MANVVVGRGKHILLLNLMEAVNYSPFIPVRLPFAPQLSMDETFKTVGVDSESFILVLIAI